jgi:hypothetical protein
VGSLVFGQAASPHFVLVSIVEQFIHTNTEKTLMSEDQKKFLIVINDGPYGGERPYNALRIAMNLIKRDSTAVKIFLLGDGVQCAVKSQETPQGYYNVERMMSSVLRRGEVAT